MNRDSQSIKEKLASRSKACQEKSVPKFLRKVFHILEDNKYSDYVSWSNDGAAIVIKKPTEFAEKVLPCYFKHNNFASFVRQLNMYNFKKKKNYHYDHVYGHESFQKGNIDLLKNIQRKCGENNPIMMPKCELKARKEDVDIDVDTLIQENLQYKRVQKTLTTQLQFIETKVRDIKTETHVLHKQFQKQKTNEEFLKKVIKILSGFYGSSNIQRAVEAATLGNTETMNHESTPDAIEGILSQYMENTEAMRPKPKVANKPYPTPSNTYTPYMHSQMYNNHNNHEEEEPHQYANYPPRDTQERKSDWNMEREIFGGLPKKTMGANPMSMIKAEHEINQQKLMQQIFNDSCSNSDSGPIAHGMEQDNYGYNQQFQHTSDKQIMPEENEGDEDEDSSNSDTYMSWYLEFERKQHNPDAFLASNNRDNGDLDLDGSMAHDSHMLLKADI